VTGGRSPLLTATPIPTPTATPTQRRIGGELSCRLARPEELRHHFDIRHAVFVAEQRLFVDSDVDDHDRDPDTLHAIGFCAGVPAGAVRLFPRRAGEWQGDRLAVLPDFRTAGLGAPLVRLAVAEATARGGKRMIAHIQVANVAFFRRLGWELDGTPETYCGVPHQPMAVTLAR
jgi:putative N-acetyltransferase (TIGR04045 family)